MLKFFFWLLVLANAGMFAYQRGVFDAFLSSGHEPARMSNQLNAEKVKVLPVAATGVAGAAVPEPSVPADPAGSAGRPAVAPADKAPAETGTTGARPPVPAPAAPPPAIAPNAPVAAVIEKKPALNACMEVGNFNVEEARRFTAQLASSQLSERATQRTVQEIVSHIVYIPSQGDKEAAEKKAGELRRLGITDFYVMPETSAMRWSISLGVFRSEEAARAHLTTLSLKGVRSARIGQRTAASSLVAFQFRNLEPEKKWLVEKIKSGFAKQEVRECEAT